MATTANVANHPSEQGETESALDEYSDNEEPVFEGSLRQLSLSDSISFSFPTNSACVYKNAIALGNVDNDSYGVRRIVSYRQPQTLNLSWAGYWIGYWKYSRRISSF